MLLSEATTTPYENLYQLVPLIVFIPVIGLLINLLFGRRFGEKFTGIVASTASGGAFVVSVLQWFALQANDGVAYVYHLADWITIGDFSIPWEFRIDSLSVVMMLVVSGVGTLIHIYATGYMRYDVRYKEDPKSYTRFFIYMNLFIAMMMILISGNNYLMLFVGWEGVGLCSFLLIGFWFNRNPDATIGLKNTAAAQKAFIANRVGDLGLLVGMFTTFWVFGSLEFDRIFPMLGTAGGHGAEHLATQPVPTWAIWMITMSFLLGVAGKSAQIPLYVWLPDAMAGPTPVSALIHAATMVTSGVYLVTRSAPLFSAIPEVKFVVSFVGALTALFAATIAVGQYDIKKVLAYSTVSQLGFMVAAVGMGAYVAGMFHLVMHAFFKALLFLGAGSIILAVERGHHPMDLDGEHGHDDEHDAHDAHHDDHGHDDHGEHFDPQDMRNMGGLRKIIPVTFWVYMAGTLALAGIAPFAGFWSKDEILLDAKLTDPLIYWMLVAAAFLTAFYMGRQIWMVFFGKPRTHAAEEAKESPPAMLIPLIVLALLSVFGGLMNIPFPIGEWAHRFGHWVGYTLEHSGVALHDAPPFNWVVAGSSTILAVTAIFISWLLYGRKPMASTEDIDPLQKGLGPIFTGMNRTWYVDDIYQFLIIDPFEKVAHFLAQTLDWDFWHDWFHNKVIAKNFKRLTHFLANPVDLGLVDGASKALASAVQNSSSFLSALQTGFVRNYALSVFMGVVIILGYLIFKPLG